MAEHTHVHPGTDRNGPADMSKQLERNNYFHGKLLDVFHLELEQEYFNSKRWLLNRLVTGAGVVCGLDVELTQDKRAIVVLQGVAIDTCGREIIVSGRSKSVPLPPMPDYQPEAASEYRQRQRREQQPEYYCEIPYAHVALCYHECLSNPVPAMTGDCDTVIQCAPGSIREQYEIQVRKGFAPERRSTFPDVIEGRRISYNAIIDYVTRPCRSLPEDCCIPLANIELRDTGSKWEPEVDIYVRPIVYTNRLLFELIQSLVKTDREEEER